MAIIVILKKLDVILSYKYKTRKRFYNEHTFTIYNRSKGKEKSRSSTYFRLGQNPKGFGSLRKTERQKHFF
jgi:hypothetical protein